MELKKFERIIISGYRLDKRTLHYSVYTNGTGKDYYLQIPQEFDVDIFFQFYKLVLATEGLAFAVVAEEVIVNIPLDDAQTDFINRIKMPFYADISVLVGKILMSPGHLGNVSYLYEKEKPINGVFVDYNKVAMCYSGGKESILSYALLQEAGYDVTPLFVNPELLGVSKTPFLPKGEVFIDTSYADSVVDTCSILPEGVWDIPVYLLTKLILATALALSNGSGNVCIGSEYATTAVTFDGYGGSLNFGHSWGQSNFAFGEFKRLLYSYNTRIEYFSPVQNFGIPMEELFMYFMYPEAFKMQHSCEHYHQDDKGNLMPCRTCIKCEILNATLAGLDKTYNLNINSRFLFDKDVETVGRNPVHYVFPYLSDEELKEIENLLKGINSMWEYSLAFDEIHSKEHLPKKFHKFLVHKEKQFYKKLWKHVSLNQPSLLKGM